MKKIFLIFTILLSFTFLTSCTTENKNLDEIYDLKVEVEYKRELTDSEYLELVDRALKVEEDNTYGTITMHNFNYEDETVRFVYDFRGSLNDYKAFYDFSNGNTMYIKDGYAYIAYDDSKVKSKLSDVYASYSVVEFKDEFIYESHDYITPYIIIKLLNDLYDTEDLELNFVGIDKRNNYVINAKVNGDDARFVFNEKYELIYVSVYDRKGISAYCMYDHKLPTIEYPNLGSYEYTE